jgi:hypothetical protein
MKNMWQYIKKYMRSIRIMIGISTFYELPVPNWTYLPGKVVSALTAKNFEDALEEFWINRELYTSADLKSQESEVKLKCKCTEYKRI